MKIANETYVKCSKCETEASGLQDINTTFGYVIKKDMLIPYTECRVCRTKQQSQTGKLPEKWHSATAWGRRLHISKRAFEKYLLELEYLKSEYSGEAHGVKQVLTPKGERHSRNVKRLFGRENVWDDKAFTGVMMKRAEDAVIHFACPKCKAHLDEMPEFSHLDYTYHCVECGHISDYCEVSVTFEQLC